MDTTAAIGAHTPKVKALEWRDNTKGGVYAHTIIGTFTAIWHGGEFYWACHEGKTVDHIHHKTLDAAKAAAQADYERRVLSALDLDTHRDLIATLVEALADARYALYGRGPGNPKIDAALSLARATLSEKGDE